MDNIIKEDIEGILSSREDWDCFRGGTILISGADSFLMSYLVYALLENNRRNGCQTRVVALCRNRRNAEGRFDGYLGDPNLLFLYQDVRQPIEYEGEIDYCIHAASPAGISSRQEYPADTFLINLWGCKNLLDFCRKGKLKKFMLLSSVDVYGDCRSQGKLRETDVGSLDWIYKRNAYSNGKRASETLCSLYYEQYGMPCVIARPFQVYGPGMSLTDGRLHGDFVRQILKSNSILLKGDGTARRSFMYLADAACAMLDVLLYGEDGGIYNICDEESECSVYELARMYAGESGKNASVGFCYDKRDTPEVKEARPVAVGSAAKLESLGWKRKNSLAEGVRRTLRFYGGENGGTFI